VDQTPALPTGSRHPSDVRELSFPEVRCAVGGLVGLQPEQLPGWFQAAGGPSTVHADVIGDSLATASL
jgi:hypothetical protein